MEGADFGGGGGGPPSELGEADAVFAGDDSLPGKHLADGGWPSSAKIRWALQPSRSLLPVRFRAVSRVKASAISSAQGSRPARKMARMVCAAGFMASKPMDNAARYGGSGSSFRVASVTIPNRPSDPTKRRASSKPVF